ncbi:hydroxyacid dehydrogenase [Advenella kashmirensis W13003]|uniref:Hydroxyacid dehydrogenase n=1 Tax=Advenella kashmirensis W13003 TaxID=1424334 RepID=V8QWN9_9BURK|nr:Ldh family oxidoreductase [Advenella kashmirensis]ETF03725.1 hydroxyacid dehydrogenase [Advenella kashmirensis W13003]
MNTRVEARVAESEWSSLGNQAFRALGLPPEAAADVVKVLVLADLFGLSTHGLSRVESYGERLRSGGINASANITTVNITPGIRMVDGDNGTGPLVGMHALRAAQSAAKACGIGVAFARGSNHFGPVSPYAYLAAQEGFASIIGSNATTTIAPWGGSDARLGNSPLGFGIPNPDGKPFLLDMAMSVVARAKIRNALRDGQSIPSTWATDGNGNPTTSPAEALNGFLLPIGGHKGYGLALMVDLFAGVLSNAAYLTHVKSWVDAPDEPQNLGHFFILIDTRQLGAAAWLSQRMTDFAAILHDSPAVDDSQPVIVPGEIELTRMAEQHTNGIKVDPNVLRMLRGFSVMQD